MQHTIEYEKISAHINFSLHSRMKIFLIAHVYLGDCMHTSGLTYAIVLKFALGRNLGTCVIISGTTRSTQKYPKII